MSIKTIDICIIYGIILLSVIFRLYLIHTNKGKKFIFYEKEKGEKNMKKVVSTLLCLTTAATMTVGLTGCDNGGSSSDTLVWYMFGDKPAGLDAVMAKANEIIEPEIGMKLDMQYIDSASFGEKMKLKMASGEAFDLAFTGYNNPYQTAVAMGGLYDITDLIKEVGFTEEEMPQFYLDAVTVDGKIYGLPNIQVVSNPVCWMMDKSLAEELNIDVQKYQDFACNIKTYEDVEKFATMLDELYAKVHEAKPEHCVINPTYYELTVPVYESLTGPVCLRQDGSTNELYLDYETPEYKLQMQKRHEWYQKGYIRSDIAAKGTTTTGNDEARQIEIRFSTWKPGQEIYCTNTYGTEQVTAFFQNPYVGRTSALATSTGVGANSKHPKEAVQLLRLVNTNKELFNILAWGIEGTNYNLNEDGKVIEIPDSGYNKIGEGAWKFGNQFNGLLMAEQEDGIWEATEEMNNTAMKSPALGFVPNTDPISTELANLTNTSSEYAAKKFGTADPAEWYDEYVQAMEAAGAKKVLDELQKQYDEFLNSKN